MPSITSAPATPGLSADSLQILQRWAATQRPQSAPQPAPAQPAAASLQRFDYLSNVQSLRSGIPATLPATLAPLPARRPVTAPAVRPAAQPANLLRSGSSGPAVEHVQERLNLWGYRTDVDGDFGSGTFRSVSRFQQDQRLPVTGQVSSATLAALDRQPPVYASEQPGISSIRAGKTQLAAGSHGPAVEYVQTRLKVWGQLKSQPDGDYGPNTTAAVKAFQREHGIQANGRVGQTTLAALDQTPVRAASLSSNSDALKLAKTAQRVASRRGTVGWCYSGVADSVSRALGVQLYGGSAYQAAPILARHPDFKEVKAVKPHELPKLPAGAIVVWGKTRVSPNGHISVALGNGREASDHVSKQLTNLRGHTNFRVFMPV